MTQEIESLRRCVGMFDTAILKIRDEIKGLEDKINALEVCRGEFRVKLHEAEEEEYLEEQLQADIAEREADENYYGNYGMPMPSDNPEYIVASTSSRAEETYVFESDSNGDRISSSEYGGIALRCGYKNWTDKTLAVGTCFPGKYYKLVRSWDWFDDDYPGSTALYKREEAPDELTYWDGDETDRIQC